LDVVTAEFWEFGEYLVSSHAAGKILEDVVRGDACTSDARLAGTDTRINDNVIREILHADSIAGTGADDQAKTMYRCSARPDTSRNSRRHLMEIAEAYRLLGHERETRVSTFTPRQSTILRLTQ
jgi:hypothetical protein